MRGRVEGCHRRDPGHPPGGSSGGRGCSQEKEMRIPVPGGLEEGVTCVTAALTLAARGTTGGPFDIRPSLPSHRICTRAAPVTLSLKPWREGCPRRPVIDSSEPLFLLTAFLR